MDSRTSDRVVNPSNVELLMAAIAGQQATGRFAPSVYVVEPTNRCNVNCVMCPNSKFDPSALGDISVESLNRVLTAIAPYSELCMLYFLGETTLHPEFSRLMYAARAALSGRLVLSTNATQLSEAVVDR